MATCKFKGCKKPIQSGDLRRKYCAEHSAVMKKVHAEQHAKFKGVIDSTPDKNIKNIKPDKAKYHCQNCNAKFNDKLDKCPSCGLGFDWSGYNE